MGLHRLTRPEAELLFSDSKTKISYSTLAKWETGARSPSFRTALKVGSVLMVPADRLATAEFEDLLANELADPIRFQAVEVKIRKVRRGLRSVPAGESGERAGEDNAMESVDMVGRDPVVSSPLRGKSARQDSKTPKKVS